MPKCIFDNIDFFDIFQLQLITLEIVVECASPTTSCTQLANPPISSSFHPFPCLCALSLVHAHMPPTRLCFRLPLGLTTGGRAKGGVCISITLASASRLYKMED